MELRPSKQGRNPIDFLPEEVWIKIFETGVSQENKFTIKDISSLLVTCKLFYKLWSEDALWSLLVTLDFPQFANDGGSKPYSSSSQKLLYKYGLARHCKHKFVYYSHQLQRVKTHISILSERIERLGDRITTETHQLELRIEGLGEVVAVKGKDDGLASLLAAAIDDMITSHCDDLAKYRKRDELMRYLVDLKEGCEKHIRCLQSCLVELCTGFNPIQLENLWVPGDKIEGDDDYNEEAVALADDYVDVDTDDDEDDYISNVDVEDEEEVNVMDDEVGDDYFFNNDAEEEEGEDIEGIKEVNVEGAGDF